VNVLGWKRKTSSKTLARRASKQVCPQFRPPPGARCCLNLWKTRDPGRRWGSGRLDHLVADVFATLHKPRKRAAMFTLQDQYCWQKIMFRS